jgi:DNA-binding SARP family transcriptional activator
VRKDAQGKAKRGTETTTAKLTTVVTYTAHRGYGNHLESDQVHRITRAELVSRNYITPRTVAQASHAGSGEGSMISAQVPPAQVTNTFASSVSPHDVDGSCVARPEQAPRALTATLLGQPQIYYAERRVAFRSKRVLALVVYLALTSQSQPRERLATLFWPDHDDLTARKLLRNMVVLLRHNLADATQIPYESISLVRAEHDALGRAALQIDRSADPSLILDTEHIEQAAVQAQRALQERLTLPEDQLLTILEAAVELYRGPFLEGVTFDDAPDLDAWVGQQRTYYQRLIEQVFDALLALRAQMGSFTDMSRVARRWLEVNPFEEAATRWLMQAVAAQGDRAGALAAYAATKQLLRAELDTDPAPETVALAERLRHDTSLLLSSTPSSGSTQPMRKPQHPSVRRLSASVGGVDLPFVGRSTEFAALVSSYELARHGQPEIVVLEGDAGIGKSRLAEEFLRWVQTKGASVLQARALDLIGHLPFQPFVDALRPRIAQENAPDDLLADPWLAEMIRLLPELHDRYPDLPAPAALVGDETTARGRLFEAVTQLIGALVVRADMSGLVLFLDNAQWMDSATLDLLQYAVRQWAQNGTAVLVLLGMRSEAFAIAPHLENWLGSLEREIALHRLILRPLTFEETRRLLAGTSEWMRASENQDDPGDQPEALIEWLFRRTGGQPFYLLEMLRTLLDQGILRHGQTRDGQPIIQIAETLDLSSLARLVPGTVRDLIRTRVAEVTDTAADLLVAASVLGKAASFDELRALAEVSEREALLALDTLLRRRLLVLAPAEERLTAHSSHTNLYTFPHELLGETIYTEAGEDRRRIFHARAFKLYVSSEPHRGSAAPREGTAASAAETARHALMSNMLEPAFRYSLAAGDATVRALGADAALALYEQALRVARELEDQSLARGVQSHIGEADLERLYTQLGHSYGVA